jgi:TolB-like protein
MEVLVYLAGLEGQVATLESIHDDLWSGKVVSSGTIYNCIAELRQALSRDDKDLVYIETIPKKGYRLAPPIVAMPLAPAVHHSGSTVAILPLSNHSRNEDIEYLCDGIAEEILHRLSKVSGLKVFSALTLKEQNLDARVVGLRFGVQMVLIGSLQKSDKRLRLTFRLDKVSNGETVWSDRYDQETADIFSLQDTVAKQVVSAISPALDIDDSNEPLLENSGTQSLEALNAFLLGRHAESKGSAEGYDDAIRYFEQAVEIDPAFARAHYRLYLTTYYKPREYGEDKISLEKSRCAAANAKKYGFQPAVPWIHIQRRLYRDTLPNTRELTREALDKIRNYDPEWGSFGYEQMAWVLPAAGFFKGALDFAIHMLDSPAHNFQDSDAHEIIPYYHGALGQFEKAIRLLSSEIQQDPAEPQMRLERSILYARTGQFGYAKGDIESLNEGRYLFLAKAFYSFWHDQPERIMKYHERFCATPNTHPVFLLCSYCMIGDLDSAIKQFSIAVNAIQWGFIEFGFIRAELRSRFPMSLVNQLEQQPGFETLLESEGIDEAWRMELAERVNDLTDITGISINPNQDL